MSFTSLVHSGEKKWVQMLRFLKRTMFLLSPPLHQFFFRLLIPLWMQHFSCFVNHWDQMSLLIFPGQEAWDWNTLTKLRSVVTSKTWKAWRPVQICLILHTSIFQPSLYTFWHSCVGWFLHNMPLKPPVVAFDWGKNMYLWGHFSTKMMMVHVCTYVEN